MTLLTCRVVPITLAVALLCFIIIPFLFGSFSYRARYLPQLLEAQKLRLYWQAACLVPGVRGTEHNIQQAIEEVALEYTMHPSLIRALVQVESSGNQMALSPVGGCGLMQVMPNTYYSLGKRNPFTVKSNLRAGTEYLRYLYRRFDGNIELALAAYNAGPGVVARRGSVPPGAVRHYVNNVMWRYRKYRDS